MNLSQIAQAQKDPNEQKRREFLLNRQTAYRRVFVTDDKASKEVLKDLRRFCRKDDSTFHPDPRIHAMLEGRREVAQRIIDHIDLPFDDLYNKFTQGEISEKENTWIG